MNDLNEIRMTYCLFCNESTFSEWKNWCSETCRKKSINFVEIKNEKTFADILLLIVEIIELLILVLYVISYGNFLSSIVSIVLFLIALAVLSMEYKREA